MMVARKIKNQPVSLLGSPIAIYFDSDYAEYQVKIKGKPSATYFTDDKNDAISTAQAMRNEEARISGLRQNPVKRKTAARTQKAAVGYVNRPSQITKKAPSKRLKTRRTINLQTPRGVFPNPAPRQLESDLKKIYAVKTKTELNAIYKAMAEKYYGNSDALSAIGDAVTYMKGAAIKKNPAKRAQEIFVQYELSGQRYAIKSPGKYDWKTLATFPLSGEGSKNAIDYAKAYHGIAPHLKIRVIEI